MALARQIDPNTGDFPDGARGSYATCDPLQNKIVLSYSIARGSWEGDRDLGHRFDELERAPDNAGTLQRLRDLVVDAVKWLLDAGELERVEVTDAERLGAGFYGWAADFYPPGRQEPLQLERQFIRLGGGDGAV